MKLTFNTNDLRRKLDKVKTAIGKAIRLITINNNLYLESNTDLASTRIYLDKTELEIKTLISSTFINIVKACPGDKIELTIKDNLVQIKSGTFKVSINQVNEVLYTEKFENITDSMIKLEEDNFKEILKVVNIAASKTHSNVSLHGTNIKFKDNTLYIQSSDSFRVSQFSKGASYQAEFNFVVMGNVVEKCLSSLKEYEVYLDNNKVYLCDTECFFIVRNIDKEYPDVEKFIKISGHEVMIDRTLLSTALDRCSIASSDNLTLIFDNKVLGLKAKSEVVEVNETLELKQCSLKDFTISMSKNYAKESIANLSGDTIRIILETAFKPVLLMNEDSSDIVHLILPIRLT